MPPFAGVKQGRGTPGFLRGPLGFVRGGIGFLDPGGGGGLKELLKWDFSQSIPAEFYQYHDRDTGAMVVDSSGQWVWSPENLKKEGNNFNSQFELAGTGNVTRTADAVSGPFVGTLGWETTVNTSNANHRNFVTGFNYVEGQRYVISVFAKAGSETVIQLGPSVSSGGSFYANFDLIAGDISFTNGGEPYMEDVGDGWYRCSLAFAAASTSTVYFCSAAAFCNNDRNAPRGSVFLGDGALSFYSYGVQIERKESDGPREYIHTDGSEYFAPRLQHDHYGNVLGYLSEPQATNEIPYSSDLTGWNNFGIGTTTEDTYTEAASGSGQSIIRVAATPNAGDIIFWADVEYVDQQWVSLFTLFDVQAEATFDILNGVAGTFKTGANDSGIIDLGGGKYRIWMTDTIGGVGSAIADVAHTGGDQSRSTNYNRTGTSSIWHHIQLEAGTHPSSHIPTKGAEVTRQADTVAPVVRSKGATEGVTMIMDATVLYSNTSASEIFSEINDGTSSNRVYLDYRFAGVQSLRGVTRENGNGYVVTYTPWPDFGERFKSGISSDSEIANRRSCLNGVAQSDVDFTAFTWPEQLDTYELKGIKLGIIYRSIWVNPKASTMEELQDLTELYAGFDPDAKTYLNSLVGDGVSIAAHQADAINDWYLAGKAAGWYSQVKRMYLPIWGQAAPNARCMVSDTSGTFVGTVTPGAGYVQSDGSTGYFNTLVSPATAGATLGSVGIGWLKNSLLRTNGGAHGCRDSLTSVLSTQTYSSLRVTMLASTDGAGQQTFAVSPSVAIGTAGITQLNRSGGKTMVRTRQSAGVTAHLDLTESDYGTVPSVEDATFMAFNVGSGIVQYCAQPYGAFFLTSGLDAVAADAFSLALKDLWETCSGLTLPI